jgi:two-component system nitrogen regulation sensor histidine kinase NtrY
MSLKWKFALLFIGLGALPFLVGAYVLLERSETSFEESFDERSELIEQGVERRFEAVASDLHLALSRIAGDSVVVSSLLEPLGRNRFYDSGVDYERTIVRESRRLMTSAVLDTLKFVDLGARRGHVIALGHRMGLEPTDAALLRLLDLVDEGVSTPVLNLERVENIATGGTDSVWVLQVVHVARSPEAQSARVALIGGRILDARFLEDLRLSGPRATQIALLDAEGRRVASTFEGSAPPEVSGDYATEVRPLLNPTLGSGAKPVATLTVFIPRTELVAYKDDLWSFGGLVLGGTFVLALLLALVSSYRIARPLSQLARATSDIAFGRRDVTVPERRGRDEVARLTQAFNQMTRDLVDSEDRLRKSERIAAWREIARRIAHEIKNPLSPIQISLETLRKAKDRQHPQFDALFTELTETMLEEVARMTRIVSEFSDFARMPAPRIVEIELVELAEQIVVLLRDSLPGASLCLEAPSLVTALVDPDQLRQVLLNLTKNALEAVAADPARAAKGGGSVRLRLRDEETFVGMSVSDDGGGMAPETRMQLFTPYFTTKASGTGLGLAIVQRIIEEHGGTITVESAIGKGTTFTVRLPKSPPRDASR